MKSAADSLFADTGFRKELAQAAGQSGKTPEQAEKYARKCLREIEATPRDSWLRPAAALARFIYTRSYERDIDINLEQLERLKVLSRDHLLLFLWSHKSHMDSFVFLLSLYQHGFRPLPLIFAGINMNFLGFGALARRVGAIFLRRSFQDDAVYKLVFRHYIDHLIRQQVPLSWSIEGTRSRTGKLSPPKLGVLNWVVEACRRERRDKVLLVPVSLAFDRIAEIEDYVAIQGGQPKRKESLRWFIDYVFGMRQPYGKVYVRYGEPLALGEAAAQPTASVGSDSGEQRLEIARLAFEVCHRIEQITPIKSADVLSLVLLGANHRALTAAEVYQQAAPIVELVHRRQLPTARGFTLDNETEVRGAILAMQQAGLVKIFDKSRTPVYYIPDGQRLAAAYYRNTITHFFLLAAISEMGLAMCARDVEMPGEANLQQHVLVLRQLYKFEFFYEPGGDFWRDVLLETTERYPRWRAGEQSLEKLLLEKPPRFGHAILRSITEAYLVIAVALLELRDQPVWDQKRFTRQLMAQGQQMLLRRTVSCDSSVSQDMFATGLRLAEHRQLLTGKNLARGREQFANEVVAALSAINLLQRTYDSAWFAQLAEGTIGSLLSS